MPDQRQAGDRFAFLDGIRDLPSLPQVLVGISRVASDPHSDAAALAEMVLKDQALTMKVLRIANSAQYAVCAQRVATISRAVVMLGFESVRAIALGLGVYKMLSTLERGGSVHEGFWKDAIAVAVTAQDLAGLIGVEVVEEAFVAGLLHDVGKLVLAEHDLDRALSVYREWREGPGLLAAEAAAFGVNHAEVAGELGRRWDLPVPLQAALAHHHRHFPNPPREGGERLAFLIAVATGVARAVAEGAGEPRPVAAQVARLLRRPVGRVLEVLRGLPDKIAEYARFFDIQVEDLKVYTVWLEDEHRRLHEAIVQEESSRRADQRRRGEMAALREIHGMLLGAAGGEQVVRRVLRAVREVTGARRVVVARLDEGRGEVEAVLGDGDVTPGFLEEFRFPAGDGILGGALERGEPVHVFDSEVPYFRRLLSQREARVLGVRCFAAVPWRDPAGAGLLFADRDAQDEPFRDEEVESLGTLTDLLRLGLRGEPRPAA